ncbi:Variant surface glycoprotein [Trypanosoma congolense IL3000]|uniref:Variant surface glycoprotein n=1 Tax=Trypanosoma congolense (strain IL3000) TaxID=1068625 RepID=F9WFS5_TRYCI|nr:Variant surface glycoprotein [Trypanosoma congolense IL3000]
MSTRFDDRGQDRFASMGNSYRNLGPVVISISNLAPSGKQSCKSAVMAGLSSSSFQRSWVLSRMPVLPLALANTVMSSLRRSPYLKARAVARMIVGESRLLGRLIFSRKFRTSCKRLSFSRVIGRPMKMKLPVKQFGCVRGTGLPELGKPPGRAGYDIV